jgi:hypothetical protein
MDTLTYKNALCRTSLFYSVQCQKILLVKERVRLTLNGLVRPSACLVNHSKVTLFPILIAICKLYISLFIPKLYYLCVSKIMSPQWSNLILSTNIPNSKTNIFIFHSFHIKPLNDRIIIMTLEELLYNI